MTMHKGKSMYFMLTQLSLKTIWPCKENYSPCIPDEETEITLSNLLKAIWTGVRTSIWAQVYWMQVVPTDIMLPAALPR